LQAVIEKGVVKIQHALIDDEDSTLHIQGGTNLRSETLKLRLVAEPKDFSPLLLRAPLNVVGSFQRLQIEVEAKGLLARAAGALALAALAPPAALLAFVDTGTEPDTPPCAPVKTVGSKSP
jgi:hypothetical protein